LKPEKEGLLDRLGVLLFFDVFCPGLPHQHPQIKFGGHPFDAHQCPQLWIGCSTILQALVTEYILESEHLGGFAL
jgi:hypothetical protein